MTVCAFAVPRWLPQRAGAVFETALPTHGRVVVFGAAGLTGLQLVRAALEEGFAVRAAVRSLGEFPLNDRRVEVVRCDVLNASEVEAALSGASAVLFAVGPRSFTESHTMSVGMSNVVAAARLAGVRRVLAVSSNGVVQDDSEPCCFRICGRPILKARV